MNYARAMLLAFRATHGALEEKTSLESHLLIWIEKWVFRSTANRACTLLTPFSVKCNVNLTIAVTKKLVGGKMEVSV